MENKEYLVCVTRSGVKNKLFTPLTCLVNGNGIKTTMKTNKSFSKRLRVTRTGKIVGRKAGQNHFNAKESRGNQLNKKRSAIFVMTNRDKRRFLPNS